MRRFARIYRSARGVVLTFVFDTFSLGYTPVRPEDGTRTAIYSCQI